VKTVDCDFHYSSDVPADYLCARGNGETRELTDAGRINNLSFSAYSPMPPHQRAMYLRFDRSPHAMPLSLIFEIRGEAALQSKVSFEAWTGSGFTPLRFIDRTQNLRFSGPVYLYVTQPLTKTAFFGIEGHWLRMSVSGSQVKRGVQVSDIILNSVNAAQKQEARPQHFSTDSYEAGKVIELLENPVLDCELWVDERLSISEAELERLIGEDPIAVDVDRKTGK
jgi:hypothetical protein